MQSKKLVSLNETLLIVLKNAGFNRIYNCSDITLLKILSIAERKLFEGDYRELIYFPYQASISFWKKVAIIVNTFVKIISLIFIFILLNFRCFIINFRNKLSLKNMLKKENIFIADTARSFEGFLELATLSQNSAVICILHPYMILELFKPFPQKNVYYTTGVMTGIRQTWRLIKFNFGAIPRVLNQNFVINATSSNCLINFFVNFSKNLMFKEFNDHVVKSINKKAIVFVRCDATYACLTESLNEAGADTVHFIHGIQFRDDITTVPVLAKYLFCSGDRGAKDFYNYITPDRIYNISAPLQVIMKPFNVLSSVIVQPIYDVVIIASFDMMWNHIYYCHLFEYFRDKNLKVLVRNHPDIPEQQRKMIIDSVGNCEVSIGNLLIDDIAKGEIILCSSEDSLLHCLIEFKKTIFYPVTDGDTHYYCDSFENVLSNLLVAADQKELQKCMLTLSEININKNNYPVDYFEKLEYLFGTNDREKMKHNFKTALIAVKNKNATCGN